MAITSANINSGNNIHHKKWQQHLPHVNIGKLLPLTHQCPKNCRTYQHFDTFSVGKIIKINIFFRPGRSHVRNWQKLVLSLKILVLLKRIFDLHTRKQNEKHPYIYGIISFESSLPRSCLERKSLSIMSFPFI